MDAPERIRVDSVVDHAYAALREWILAGALAPGTRLPQETLARELGISRTPLREALRLLATDGLVVLETNRGATVAPLASGDQRHAWEARLAIEPGAARLAAAARDRDGVLAMRAAIARQHRAGADAGPSFEANRDFHLALAAASGNPHLRRFAELLWVPRIGITIYRRQAGDPAQMLAWADEHAAIADAVEAGDAAAAERLTRAHIARYPPPAGRG